MDPKTNIITNQRLVTPLNLQSRQTDYGRINNAIDLLIAEGGESFYNYVEWLGLAKDPNLVVISSLHHYYYDAEDMNNVKTIISLKELNQMKEIKSFLHSSEHVLPQKTNFIGCFVDNKKINGYGLRKSSSASYNKRSFDAIENGIVSSNPFLNMFFSFMDLKTNKYLSGRSVSLLLEDHGFKVKNMTELNGLTYFHSQKVRGN